MIDRTTKLRWRRRLRRSKQHVEEFGVTAEDQLEKHFFTRLSRLTKVRRFMAAWVLLFILLIGGVLYQTRSLGSYYLQPTPTKGGIFTEGILGSFTNANPLYSSGSVDNSVEHLVFSGLFKFDQNNKLVSDLAKDWKLDDRGTTYTVTLKDNLRWHDGQSLDADDVVYTYSMIQNPDAKSPLASSWQGIKVVAINKKTITFTLPSILSAFPFSMTNGIVPRHLLKGVPPGQLRSVSFNTNNPIGSGPFKWKAVEVTGNNPDDREQRIALVPNEMYVGKAPNIDKFIIRTFQTEEQLSSAFEHQELSAAAGLTAVPGKVKDDNSVHAYNIPLTSEVMVFFKTSSEILQDISVRRALNYGINTSQLLAGIGRPVLPVRGPLLREQIGYDPTITQNTGNAQLAAQLLDSAGWKVGAKGLRYKDKKLLSFTLTTQRNSVYDNVAASLKRQWQALGVSLQIVQLDDTELQSALAVHNYDALLYGIALGADPDVFAYWHSSQADLRSPNRLNFSEYRSPKADKALEAGRTRSEENIRAIKYKPFLEAWRDDVPALALYQPRFLYVVRDPLFNFNSTVMNSGADRYNNIQNWMIRISDQPIVEN